MNTIVQELTEAIENGYGYLGVIGRIQKEYDLDYDVAYRLHHLMLEHEYGTDSSYEDFTKKARIVLGTIGEEVGNHWVYEGNEPIVQHKTAIFANNSNLSYQDQLENLNTDFPGVSWTNLELYDGELCLWVPSYLTATLTTDLEVLLNMLQQFIAAGRDTIEVEGEYYDFICETANHICVMYGNRLADHIYN